MYPLRCPHKMPRCFPKIFPQDDLPRGFLLSFLGFQSLIAQIHMTDLFCMGSALKLLKKNLSPGLKIWCTCYHFSHKRVAGGATAVALCSHQNGVMDHFCIGTFYEFFLISTFYWYLFISICMYFLLLLSFLLHSFLVHWEYSSCSALLQPNWSDILDRFCIGTFFFDK